jgi:hypothetical protein
MSCGKQEHRPESVMSYKEHLFFSDISSGLWAVKLEPKDRPGM